MKKIAIILPAYNEEQTISGTIESFYNELSDAEIVVINNNSQDDTATVAMETFSRLKANGRVISEFRQGKGNAIRRAFADVHADIYVMSDADLTYPAEQVHELIKPLHDDVADMVVGDRHSSGHYQKENKRQFHGFGNWLVQKLVNRLFKASLVDIMSGYRAFNRLFVKNYPILVEGFEIETDMTLHALDKRLRVIEIPIKYKDRPAGSVSKLNTLRDGIKVLHTIARIFRYYQPLAFFGSVAVLFASTGLLAGIPVINDWLMEQYIHHVPLAILATGLEIVAIMLMAIGLILDSITHQNKRHFEHELLKNR